MRSSPRLFDLQEARSRQAEALALAQNDAKMELERTQVEIKVKDKVLEQQQREIQALKVRSFQFLYWNTMCDHEDVALLLHFACAVSILVDVARDVARQDKLAKRGSRLRPGSNGESSSDPARNFAGSI